MRPVTARPTRPQLKRAWPVIGWPSDLNSYTFEQAQDYAAARGFFERMDRFFMIEGVDQSQALIEILLRPFRGCRNGMMEGSEIGEKRHSVRRGARHGVRQHEDQTQSRIANAPPHQAMSANTRIGNVLLMATRRGDQCCE